jgi:hypothetical protein
MERQQHVVGTTTGMVLRGLFSNPPEPLADLLSFPALTDEKLKRRKTRTAFKPS